MKLFCEIYKHVGDAIKNFLTDIKEATLKMIDADLAKTTKFEKGEFQKKRQVRGADEEEEKGGSGGGKKKKNEEEDLLGDMPREDISKKITGKILEQFKHKDWKIRKKGVEDIEGILRDAKMRIENSGLNDLMDAVKNGLKDSNKAVVKPMINLCGLLAEALGKDIRVYTKKIFVPMLNNLSDKQSLVRSECLPTINKWADAVGPELVINKLMEVLMVENPESRGESFKWILEHIDDVPNADTSVMIKPLISCLTDKLKATRENAEKVIGIIMPIVGYQTFLDSTKDQK